HFGHLTYRPSDPAEHNVLNQTIEGAERFGTPVDVELKAGEVSLHSDLLLHGSETNHSARRRCGLTLRYCAADVRAGLGWHAKGGAGQWPRPPRPLGQPAAPRGRLTRSPSAVTALPRRLLARPVCGCRQVHGQDPPRHPADLVRLTPGQPAAVRINAVGG